MTVEERKQEYFSRVPKDPNAWTCEHCGLNDPQTPKNVQFNHWWCYGGGHRKKAFEIFHGQGAE